ncbi:hypothetical protein XF_0471 [Xylella fastidiosa 9a5c]|uniref:Uncharacterized protein n=1 Tax=Xylella fastidiosa (strain 9a5c) TaxID=160492 RepID=Q9PG31_XYLFA|nr:hypothetical protein XF_0471 [Xylella fastidiosa 9a5c]
MLARWAELSVAADLCCDPPLFCIQMVFGVIYLLRGVIDFEAV